MWEARAVTALLDAHADWQLPELPQLSTWLELAGLRLWLRDATTVNPATVTVSRYRYRGERIRTPWSPTPTSSPA